MSNREVYAVNRRGFTLIELLIVTVIGLFILQAAYLLYSGSFKLFQDVKTQADNVQTRIPTIELIGRYFDRWGVNVLESGANCSAYPPVNAKCITKSAQSGLGTGISCDEVTFWGNIYGFGLVQSVVGSPAVANLVSCRLQYSATKHNCYYLWRNNLLQNQTVSGFLAILQLNSNLNPSNADCAGLASTATSNATVSATLTPTAAAQMLGAVNKTVVAGDILQRAPHQIRLFCGANASDGDRNWLYVDLTDTSMACGMDESAVPIAPVNSFQVELLPSGCTATSGTCSAARVTVTFRSQSEKSSGVHATQTVQRVYGR
jgi:prepilin-type N-terminal cleavage/methylation domain-containing protein